MDNPATAGLVMFQLAAAEVVLGKLSYQDALHQARRALAHVLIAGLVKECRYPKEQRREFFEASLLASLDLIQAEREEQLKVLQKELRDFYFKGLTTTSQ